MDSFMGFSIKAINQWCAVSESGEIDPTAHRDAIKAGLVANINDEVWVAPSGSESGGSPQFWVTTLTLLRRSGVLVGKPLAAGVVEVVREFGDRVVPTGSFLEVGIISGSVFTPIGDSKVQASDTEPTDSEEPPTPETPVLSEPVPVVSSSSSQEEPSIAEPVVAEITPNDTLRASIAAIPSHYTSMKEPLNRLVDLGASSVVIETALAMAGKPYHLGKISMYSQEITRLLAQGSDDLMTLVQTAHKEACKTNCESLADEKIMLAVMEHIPDNRKSAFKQKFEDQIKAGLNKYWSESWTQVSAAMEVGRCNTPVNLFFHIIKDMDHNSGLSEQRGVAHLESFSECRWIMEYLPKTPVDYDDNSSLKGGNRKHYLPRMKDAIERAGHIPLVWLFTMAVDNDYPTRALAGAAEAMITKFPALARIVTRDQFDYAMNLVVKTFTDRAILADASWDKRYDTPHLGASLYHHAVFAGKQYIQTFQEYAAADMKFLTSETKAAIIDLVGNAEAMLVLDRWYLNTNPWKQGKTQEAAYAHLLEEQEQESRVAAYRESQRGASEYRIPEIGEDLEPVSDPQD